MTQTIEIIEERAGWLAISKPAGLAVHNTEKGDSLLAILNAELGVTLHAAHRLDRSTYGIILLGKDPQNTRMLQQALKHASKEYTAILRGVLDPPNGNWSWPLSNQGEGFRNPQGRKRDRVSAKTQYKNILSNQYFSQVDIVLATGRQHQIRKHAALAGHAIIGDDRYGNRQYNRMIQQRYGTVQLCLCAKKLTIELQSEHFEFNVSIPDSWGVFF